MSKIETRKGTLDMPFEQQSFMVSAETKMGKSTLFAGANALYFDIDGTLSHLPVDSIKVPDWKTFCDKEWRAEVREYYKQGGYQFKVIDTMSKLYDLCEYAECDARGITDPSEAQDDSGKGVNVYGVAGRSFMNNMMWLVQSPGTVLLCHAVIRKVNVVQNVVVNGKPMQKTVKIDQLVPSLRPGALRSINPFVQNSFHIGYSSTKEQDVMVGTRSLYTRNTPLFGGGCRMDADELPDEIVLPFEKPLEGFKVLEEAWNKANQIRKGK